MAAFMASTNAAAESNGKLCATTKLLWNTVVSTATPSAPPTSRTVLFAPDALPCSCGRTEASTTAIVGANTSPMPTPDTASAGTSFG